MSNYLNELDLDLLSSSTAVQFDPTSHSENRSNVRVQLSIDDAIINGILSEADEEQFLYEKFAFHVKQEVAGSGRRLLLWVASSRDSEWNLLYQLRIKTGVNNGSPKVVDSDMVEFFPHCPSLSVDLKEDVATVKFELRTVNKLYLAHPQFNDGDISIKFNDGTSLRTHRALLAIASKYMANRCSDTSVDCLDVDDFPRKDFCELLYQLYPTRRPLWGDFRGLSRAALAFKSDSVIYALSKHLIEYNRKPMSLEDRMKAALDLELHTVVEELVFRAAQSGAWGHMIRLGFEPESFFTPPVYRNIVCPAIIEARRRTVMDSLLKNPYATPDYFSDVARQNPNNTTVVFRGTPFHVNKGVLAVHGTTAFRTDNNGNLLAIFSRELQLQCGKGGVIPGEVLVSLFNSFYPGGPMVEAKFLRAAIVFCHDHQWNIAKESLEQLLLLEPAVSTENYLEQLKFAESFGLENMMRNCVYRAEASCNEYANALISLREFETLSRATRDRIIDRLCSGWALEPKYVNRLGIRNPTPNLHRVAGLQTGGPVGFDTMEDTLLELNSEYCFGAAEELRVDEIVI